MSTARDTIYNALFQRLKTKLGSNVVTIGRRHMMPPNLTTAMQPAVFVVQGPEERDQHARGTGGKVTLHAFVIAYCYDNSTDPSGTTLLNTLIGQIEDALAPDAAAGGFDDEVQNLGGAVYSCWIEGQTDVDPGVFGQQAVAVIPVHMLVP